MSTKALPRGEGGPEGVGRGMRAVMFDNEKPAGLFPGHLLPPFNFLAFPAIFHYNDIVKNIAEMRYRTYVNQNCRPRRQ